MAKHLNNSELEKNIQELHQILSVANNKIILPETLHGENLLHLLTDVEQEPKKTRKNNVHVLSWQALLTYAAVFGIVFIGLSSIKVPAPMASEMVNTGIEIAYAPEAEEVEEEVAYDTFSEPINDTVVADTTILKEGSSSDSVILEGGISKTEDAPLVGGQEPRTASPAVGGGSMSNTLGTWESYSVAWRANDTSDPDKIGYPVTIELIDTTSSEVAKQIDFTSVTSITDFYVAGDNMLVTGPGPNGYELFCYTDDGTEIVSLVQPGNKKLTLKQDDVIITASTSSSLADSWENTVIFDSADEGHIYFSAINIGTGDMATLGLQGVPSQAITMKNNISTIQYTTITGEPETLAILYQNGEFLLEETQEES